MDCRWQVKLASGGFYLGVVGNVALSFLFFPVTRGSSLLPLFGLTSEACIKYHIWLGHIAMALFTAHGICFIIFWAITNEISEVIIIHTILSFFVTSHLSIYTHAQVHLHIRIQICFSDKDRYVCYHFILYIRVLQTKIFM